MIYLACDPDILVSKSLSIITLTLIDIFLSSVHLLLFFLECDMTEPQVGDFVLMLSTYETQWKLLFLAPVFSRSKRSKLFKDSALNNKMSILCPLGVISA